MWRWLWVYPLIITSALAQNQYGPDYVLLHATSPDPYSNLALGNPPKPGLVPLTAPQGASILYFDPTSTCLKVSINGGSYNCIGGSSTLNYVVVSNGLKCDGSSDDTGAMSSLLTTIGSNHASLFFTKATPCLLGNVTFPSNTTLDFSQGGSIQPITSATAPGGAAFVSGSGVECGSAATCAISSFSTISGNTLVALVEMYPGFTFVTNSVTDSCGNSYFNAQYTLAGQPRNESAWVANNVIGGSCTITANFNGTATSSQVIVQQYSGLGPLVTIDGTLSDNRATGTTMSSGSATTTSGSLLIAYGGQPFTNETCTAGAGYIQPVGTAGQTTSGFLCAEYKLSSAGGATSATQTITVDPSPGTWVYALLALKPGSATVTVKGGINDPDLHQVFFNALGGQGTIDLTGNVGITEVHPEWWGAFPTASASVNTPALQAAIYGAFGCGPVRCRINGSGLNGYNRPLYLNGNYSINAELQFYHVLGFKVICNGRLQGGVTQTSTNLRILDGQSDAYGAFYDCSWTSSASSTNALIDLDFDGTHGNDLRPQFIDFYNNNFNGNGLVDVGVLIAKSGGGAQGSNIYCYDCETQNFTGAGWQIGGNNTGRNVGRFYAQNALDIGYTGDMQGNPLYGIAVYGGGYVGFGSAQAMSSMENGFTTQTGYDMYCEATQGPCSMEHMRSESRKLAAGSDLRIKDSRTINQAGFPTPGQTSPVGSIFMGSHVAGDGQYYQVTIDNVGGFNGVGTISSPEHATGGSATTVVNSLASYTVNGFNGMLVAVLGGTNIGCYGVITSNTATTITAASGWITKYYQIPCTAPDATSTFIVEPNWNGGTVVDGSVTMVALNEDGIGPCNGCVASAMHLEDVDVPGDKIRLAVNGTYLSNVTTTRPDWYDGQGSNNSTSQQFMARYWDVRVGDKTLPNGATGTFYQSWAQASSPTNRTYSGPFHVDVGTVPFVWSTGVAGGVPTAARDVWVGGRSDPAAGNSASRNILEIGGTLGPPTQFGIDQGGTLFRVQGGLPTGAGVPGDIAFSTGNAGGSGTTITDGTDRWLIKGPTGHLFANTDNVNDIGASGANRPRNVYAATSLNAGGSNGGFTGTEGTGASLTPGTNVDLMWPDSTTHRWLVNDNNAGADYVGDALIQDCGTTSTCSHTLLLKPQIVKGTVPLSTGTVTVTGISPAFTSTSTFNCVCNDTTTPANSCKIVPASASSITGTGTGSDVLSYLCAGN